MVQIVGLGRQGGPSQTRLGAAEFWPLFPIPPFAAKRVWSLAERRGVHNRANGFHPVAVDSRCNIEHGLRLWVHAAHLRHITP